MIFLFQGCILWFHVNLLGCTLQGTIIYIQNCDLRSYAKFPGKYLFKKKHILDKLHISAPVVQKSAPQAFGWDEAPQDRGQIDTWNDNVGRQKVSFWRRNLPTNSPMDQRWELYSYWKLDIWNWKSPLSNDSQLVADLHCGICPFRSKCTSKTWKFFSGNSRSTTMWGFLMMPFKFQALWGSKIQTRWSNTAPNMVSEEGIFLVSKIGASRHFGVTNPRGHGGCLLRKKLLSVHTHTKNGQTLRLLSIIGGNYMPLPICLQSYHSRCTKNSWES